MASHTDALWPCHAIFLPYKCLLKETALNLLFPVKYVVSHPRTQQNVPSQDLNPDRSIQRQAHYFMRLSHLCVKLCNL